MSTSQRRRWKKSQERGGEVKDERWGKDKGGDDEEGEERGRRREATTS